ncbi:MAG: MMPL family transporter, partial [Verrucomicrobiae bacterium]|nr:MMPL family transporter [Verrucomicrobiae bacterium]
MNPGPARLAEQLLARVGAAVCRRPRFFLAAHAVLFVACLAYTILYLEFDPSRNNLVGANKRYHQNFLAFKREFPFQDDLVVVVESEDSRKNREFVERLGAKLERESGVFTNVFYKGDLKLMGAKALQFVPEPELKALLETLRTTRPFIKQFTVASNLVSLFELVNTQFRTAKRTEHESTDSLVRALPALARIVQAAADAVRRPGIPPSPGVNALFGAGPEAEREAYITFADGRLYLVVAHAVSEQMSEAAVTRLRELVEETQREVPGLNVGLTGEPVLELDEMRQSRKDTTAAGLLALLLCALIFVCGYNETGRPIKVTICLGVGLVYTLGFTTLAIGHLNILTVTFVPILIGLAIDFGIHLVTRYEEELRSGCIESDALRRAMARTGPGIVTGALTTAGAFFAMVLTDFKGIQEMGVICGCGLLLCLLPMFTLLPVLLLRGRQNILDKGLAAELPARARLEQWWLAKPGMTVCITLAACAAALTQLGKARFDYNLLNMQSKDLPAVVFERKLIESASKSVLFAAVLADSDAEALAFEEKLKNLPAVSSIESLGRFMAQDPGPKLELIKAIKAEIADLDFAPLDTNVVNVPELSRTLWSLQGYLGLAIEEAAAQAPEIAEQLSSLRDAIVRFRAQMLAEAHKDAPEKLGAYQRALFADLHETFSALKLQDDTCGLTTADLPEVLRNRFVGVTGKRLLQVYPKKDIWQRANQHEFIMQLREALDPQNTNKPIITGTPVQLYEYTGLLKRSYEQAAAYAFVVIAVLVFIHFRSVLPVGLALTPVFIGGIWLVGLMGALGLQFNPANIMTLPLIVGIGVTNGIHILNRIME